MAETVNLNKFRKARTREEEKSRAAEESHQVWQNQGREGKRSTCGGTAEREAAGRRLEPKKSINHGTAQSSKIYAKGAA